MANLSVSLETGSSHILLKYFRRISEAQTSKVVIEGEGTLSWFEYFQVRTLGVKIFWYYIYIYVYFYVCTSMLKRKEEIHIVFNKHYIQTVEKDKNLKLVLS